MRKMLLLFGMFLKTSPPESSLRQLLSSCGTMFKLSGYSTLVMLIRERRIPLDQKLPDTRLPESSLFCSSHVKDDDAS
jgi:hypothetical protein